MVGSTTSVSTVAAIKPPITVRGRLLDSPGTNLYYLSVVRVKSQKPEIRSGVIAPPSFSGHETFPFRYAWLKKGVDAVSQDPLVFSDDRAMIKLGVGKNMVRSIRHWCLAARLIEEGPEVPSNHGRYLHLVTYAA
jgi:hypothetical protein